MFWGLEDIWICPEEEANGGGDGGGGEGINDSLDPFPAYLEPVRAAAALVNAGSACIDDGGSNSL